MLKKFHGNQNHKLLAAGKIIFAENYNTMYWTLELASKLEDAPWPANKDELIDFAIRSGAPMEVVENLQELEDDGEMYDSIIEDIWPDYPIRTTFSLMKMNINHN